MEYSKDASHWGEELPMRCPNCANNIEDKFLFCPNCGQQLASIGAEEAEQAIDFIDAVLDQMESSLDMSPAGIERAKNYISRAVAYIESFTKSLKEFMILHIRLRDEPGIIVDDEWSTEIEIELIALATFAKRLRGGTPGAMGGLLDAPAGCQSVSFYFLKLSMHLDDFVSQYIRFLRSRDTRYFVNASNELKKIFQFYDSAVDSISEVSERLPK